MEVKKIKKILIISLILIIVAISAAILSSGCGDKGEMSCRDCADYQKCCRDSEGNVKCVAADVPCAACKKGETMCLNVEELSQTCCSTSQRCIPDPFPSPAGYVARCEEKHPNDNCGPCETYNEELLQCVPLFDGTHCASDNPCVIKECVGGNCNFKEYRDGSSCVDDDGISGICSNGRCNIPLPTPTPVEECGNCAAPNPVCCATSGQCVGNVDEDCLVCDINQLPCGFGFTRYCCEAWERCLVSSELGNVCVQELNPECDLCEVSDGFGGCVNLPDGTGCPSEYECEPKICQNGQCVADPDYDKWKGAPCRTSGFGPGECKEAPGPGTSMVCSPI